jgi:murein DD-endopeptidase MepM/ murein hydrolase activator NlpD
MNSVFTLFFFFILSSIAISAKAQIIDKSLSRVYFEQNEQGGYDFYGENNGYCPISVMIEFTTLKNLQSSKPLPFKGVIKQGEQKQLLFTLVALPNTQNKFNYKFNLHWGDYTKSRHNNSYNYRLPYEKGLAYKIMQGYFGEFSHQDEYALDFDMPEGTNICATREGVVVAVKQDSDQGGSTKEFAKYGNYVCIVHNDGTFAKYFHFKQYGVIVRPGQNVARGEIIGLSGNTGWSTAPHLHFEVFQTTLSQEKTVPTRFTVAINKSVELKKGDSFKAFE